MNNFKFSIFTLSILLSVIGCGRNSGNPTEVVDIEQQNNSHDKISIEDQYQDENPDENIDVEGVPATPVENNDGDVAEDDGEDKPENNQSEDDVLADLEELLKKTQESEELLRLGEEIYGWSRVLSLNSYTNRLETFYLQYTPALEIIENRRNEAENYKVAVQAFSHASAAISDAYLEHLNQRIKMLDYLENKIRTKGWKGMLQEQIWNAGDMKNFLESYPVECKDLIDDFLLFANKTHNYETFQTTEVLYYNLVKSCDEKSI